MVRLAKYVEEFTGGCSVSNLASLRFGTTVPEVLARDFGIRPRHNWELVSQVRELASQVRVVSGLTPLVSLPFLLTKLTKQPHHAPPQCTPVVEKDAASVAQPNLRVVQGWVAGVDPGAQTVRVVSPDNPQVEQLLHYGNLCICAGARPKVGFGIDLTRSFHWMGQQKDQEQEQQKERKQEQKQEQQKEQHEQEDCNGRAAGLRGRGFQGAKWRVSGCWSIPGFQRVACRSTKSSVMGACHWGCSALCLNRTTCATRFSADPGACTPREGGDTQRHRIHTGDHAWDACTPHPACQTLKGPLVLNALTVMIVDVVKRELNCRPPFEVQSLKQDGQSTQCFHPPPYTSAGLCSPPCQHKTRGGGGQRRHRFGAGVSAFI